MALSVDEEQAGKETVPTEVKNEVSEAEPVKKTAARRSRTKKTTEEEENG